MLKALRLLNALLRLLLLKRGFADKPETRVSFFSIGFIFKLAGLGIITLGGLIGLELTELTGLPVLITVVTIATIPAATQLTALVAKVLCLRSEEQVGLADCIYLYHFSEIKI